MHRLRYNKICTVCGGTFVSKACHARFCSRKCYYIDYKKRGTQLAKPKEHTCKHCGVVFMAKQNPVYCSGECRRTAASIRAKAKYKPVVKHLKCQHCGAGFSTTYIRKYCSDKCAKQKIATQSRASAERHGAQPKSEWIHATCKECDSAFERYHPADVSCEPCRAKRRVGAKLVCEGCSEAFTVTSHQSKTPRFCSIVCAAKARTAFKIESSKVRFQKCRWCDEVMSPRRLHGMTCPGECVVMMSRVNTWASDRNIQVHDAVPLYKNTISTKQCAECNRDYTPSTSGAMHCSTKCRKKRYRRIGKAKRRAMKKSTNLNHRNIDPISILERDGWRCYICGTDTPRRLRGTIEDNAPEIDHVWPLAQGGKHTEDNLRCSCRVCNQAKGDTWLILFDDVMRSGRGWAKASSRD